MENHPAIAAEFIVYFLDEIQALRCKVSVEKYIIALFAILFEPEESRNELSCKVVFFGECLDLIKFAIGTIVNHNYFVLLPCRLVVVSAR